MSVVPKTIVGTIEFAEGHLAQWAANAVAMGSSAPEIASVTAKTTAARSAYVARNEAKIAAQSATVDEHDALKVLSDALSDLIKKVRAKAATDGEGIYSLAGIPVPAIPSPVGSPGTPTDFKVTLNPDGSLKLKWQCINPSGSVGTIYQIARQIGEGALVSIGVSGKKSYTDPTVPAGAASITYQIQAVRTTSLGLAALFTVRIGTSDSGGLTASVAPRLAA